MRIGEINKENYAEYLKMFGGTNTKTLDNASRHRSKTLEIPNNICLFPILPYTPEMNPIEQIWKELRKIGFKNEVFSTLEKVVDRLCNLLWRFLKIPLDILLDVIGFLSLNI